MGVRTIVDWTEDISCLYDSVSGFAFGQVFGGAEEADEFLEWYHERFLHSSDDPRKLSEQGLVDRVQLWRREE